VLPVERLYGQRPMLVVENGRCERCSTCTPRGCLDLARDRTVAQVLGPVRRQRAWMLSPFGLFATAFPGFVLGYFTVGDATPSQALPLYAHVLGYSAGSAAVLSAMLWSAAASSTRALPWLAALSAAIYYWFAVPVLLAAVGMSASAATWSVRLLLLLVLGAWLRRAERPQRPAGRSLAVLESADA
jgi:hypothetical protein